MVTYYQANGFLKHAEEDVYESGCQPDTANSYFGDMVFTGDTVGQVIEQVKAFCGADDDGLLLNSCEEVGRLDVQVIENEQGLPLTEQEIEQWKSGEKRAWLVCYTWEVKRMAEEDVDLVAPYNIDKDHPLYDEVFGYGE